VVDRARTLEAHRESTFNEKRLAAIDYDLRVIFRRARYINGAIVLGTIAAFLTALTVTLLFASEFTPLGVGPLIAVMFVSSMVSLSLAFLLFLLEVRIAINALRIGTHRYD